MLKLSKQFVLFLFVYPLEAILLTKQHFFFTVAFSHGQTFQDGDLYFSVSPAEHSVVEGLSVRLRCEAMPSLHVRYSWKREGKPLAPNPRSHQIDGDLNITRAHRMDSGNYVCVATHEKTGRSIESSPAKIDVQCKSYYLSLNYCF